MRWTEQAPALRCNQSMRWLTVRRCWPRCSPPPLTAAGRRGGGGREAILQHLVVHAEERGGLLLGEVYASDAPSPAAASCTSRRPCGGGLLWDRRVAAHVERRVDAAAAACARRK